MNVDAQVVMAILAFGGIGVTGLTEMFKRMFKIKDFWVYILSLAVSAGATAATLVTMQAFAWLPFAIYTIVVFLESNGIYKAFNKPKP